MNRDDLLLEYAELEVCPAAGLARAALEGDGLAYEVFFSDVAPDVVDVPGGIAMSEIEVGKRYLFFMATNFFLGEVAKASAFEVRLKVPWFITYVVGPISRFRQIGNLMRGEIESFDSCILPHRLRIGALCNYVEWPYSLPSTVSSDNAMSLSEYYGPQALEWKQ